MSYYMGIDIGGTIIKGGLINSKGQIVEKVFKSTEAPKGKKQVIDNIIFVIEELMNGNPKKVKAIGIGAPGPVDIENGIVHELVNIPGWKTVNLRAILKKKFKKPIVIDNDANCFVLAEHKYGLAKGKKNVIGFVIGTGLGAGIIIDNKIYRGTNNSAGEIGLIPYKGINLEEFSGSLALKRLSQMMGKRISGLKLYELARHRNSYARSVFNEYGNNLATPLSIIMNCYDPDMVIIGGGVSDSFPYFKSSLIENLKKYLFKESSKNLKVVKYSLKHARIIGAACLVMK